MMSTIKIQTILLDELLSKLYPRKYMCFCNLKEYWNDENRKYDRLSRQRSMLRDAKEIEKMLCVVTANNVEHAVHILCILINSNRKLSQTFVKKFKPKYAEQLDNDSNIVRSIGTFISDGDKTTNSPKEQNEALKEIGPS